MVSKQISLEPSSAQWPMTALGSSAARRSRSQAGSSSLLVVAEEGVDVLDAEAGDDALEADAAVEGAAEVLEQGDLAVGAGGEVAVAAFGGDGGVAASCRPR